MDHHDKTGRSVRITAHGPNTAVEIDGDKLDFDAIGAYSVSQLPGEAAHVVLHLANREDTRFDGYARVSVADVPDPGPAAAVFLGAIDAEELEHAALARPDLGTGKHSLTQAMLTQLGEWARGV
ncbi:hypothetical protein ACFRKB_12060 [Streptomyces scopuliridis]|uniref:hypothetical protein n=1 Tax=Streptomyces scopuliridis TaxID=452529 RepID=UPI003697013D